MPRLAPLIASLCLGCAFGAEPLVIHHSGSLTVLQDHLGGIGGINTDEARSRAFAEQPPHTGAQQPGDLAPRFRKSVPTPMPTVTMRLEQSALHVHLPPGEASATFGISVTFQRGLLTRFSPAADVWVDGRLEPREIHYVLDPPWPTDKTVGSLIWPQVVAGTGDPANTVPPRRAPPLVAAAVLRVGEQSADALSFRGLGHLAAPLWAGHIYPREYGLRVTASTEAHAEGTVTALPELWLADVRADGTAAVHRVNEIAADRTSAYIDDWFSDAEYSAGALETLQEDLRLALIQDGLFADEAFDLLTRNTAYFTSPGRRLLYLLPRTWTDAHLPLKISRDAHVVRSLIGCIDLVTEEQEDALTRIAAGPVSQPGWYYELIRRELVDGPDGQPTWKPGSAERIKALFAGEAGVLQRLGVEVPEDYAAYLSLGRFRDALLMEYERRTQDPELARFCETYLVDQTRAMVDAAAEGNARVKLRPPRP